MKIVAVATHHEQPGAQILLADGSLISLKTGDWLYTEAEWHAAISRHIDTEEELADENARLRMLLELAREPA